MKLKDIDVVLDKLKFDDVELQALLTMLAIRTVTLVDNLALEMLHVGKDNFDTKKYKDREELFINLATLRAILLKTEGDETNE